MADRYTIYRGVFQASIGREKTCSNAVTAIAKVIRRLDALGVLNATGETDSNAKLVLVLVLLEFDF